MALPRLVSIDHRREPPPPRSWHPHHCADAPSRGRWTANPLAGAIGGGAAVQAHGPLQIPKAPRADAMKALALLAASSRSTPLITSRPASAADGCRPHPHGDRDLQERPQLTDAGKSTASLQGGVAAGSRVPGDHKGSPRSRTGPPQGTTSAWASPPAHETLPHQTAMDPEPRPRREGWAGYLSRAARVRQPEPHIREGQFWKERHSPTTWEAPATR